MENVTREVEQRLQFCIQIRYVFYLAIRFKLLFAILAKNMSLIFMPYSCDLTCFCCCARSVKKVHGGILICAVLFATAAIF